MAKDGPTEKRIARFISKSTSTRSTHYLADKIEFDISSESPLFAILLSWNRPLQTFTALVLVRNVHFKTH